MAGVGTIRQVFRFMTVLALSCAATVIVVTAVDIAPADAEPMPVGVPGTWALKFDEEFNTAGLNTSVWTPGWQHTGVSGPMSGQCLSSVLVNQPNDGYLHFNVAPEHHACESEGEYASHEYTGALVESNPGDGVAGHSGFSYQYGYVEWRAYVSGAEGGELPDWPGLWTVPAYQGTKHETEMDTMEGLYGKPCFHVLNFLIHEEVGGCSSGGYAGGWHTYGMNWESGTVAFYYDGKWVGEEYNNTFKPQYLIMDLVPPAPYRNAPVGAEMKVDYVRVWQHPGPPTATTGGASGVEGSQATVGGTVNPDGVETGYAFEYGETTSYGHHSQPEGKLPAGWSTVPVGARITGLTAGKVYHYRLVASSVAGVSYGADHTFRVEGQPNLLVNSSFLLENAEGNGAVPQGWEVWENGGHAQFSRVVNEESAEQGSTYEEWNASVSQASMGQDVYDYPQVGQNYTFSVWMRAPGATMKGMIAIYGMKAGEARDRTEAHFTIKGLENKGKGQEGWQLVSVPLTVTRTEEEHIRVQVYEETPNTNLDLDGATLK